MRSILCLPLVCLIVANSPAQDKAESHKSLIAKVRPSVVTIRVQGRDGDEIGIGTGFVIDKNLIATNYHVINEGRPFTVQSSDKKPLTVIAVEASDVASDLVLIKIKNGKPDLVPLELAVPGTAEQGLRVLAFGNPLGLQNSVVEGIVSAKRDVDGRELLQLAMPIEPGNSGGPLVDMQGRVHGIINMKSAINDNLGFAIPIDQLNLLKDNPNPVAMDVWARLGKINPQRWEPLMGANWQQKGGRITARGMGKGFGGRSICLAKIEVPNVPFEIAVNVRLDDEAGAAGLVFHSDGGDRHYGFYPSGGNLRLSCFKGPSVYSWEVLKEVPSESYVRGQWNHLKVRVEAERILCYVNGQLVIESNDRQLTVGKVGMAKFRGTRPDFKQFQVGKRIESRTLTSDAKKWLQTLDTAPIDFNAIQSEQIKQLGESGELSSQEIIKRAATLERQAKQLRRLAEDVRRAATIAELDVTVNQEGPDQLLKSTLLIARLDNPDIDISTYIERIDQMADEIRESLTEDTSPIQRRDAMHDYLFKKNGFHGSRSEYYHPANSHLNRVIDDREGLPITMAILYMELGRRLDLDIEGVGLPGHFVVRHVVDDERSQLVDVFDRGDLMSQDEAETMVLLNTRRQHTKEDFRANTNLEILTRVLNNLVGIAGRDEDGEAMLRYCDALVAINPMATQYRMMRAQLRGFTDRKAAAIEDLDWLLQRDPPDLDRRMAERMRAALEE